MSLRSLFCLFLSGRFTQVYCSANIETLPSPLSKDVSNDKREASEIAMRSMAVVLYCCFSGYHCSNAFVGFLFCCAALRAISSFTVISLGKRELVALLYMYFDVK